MKLRLFHGLVFTAAVSTVAFSCNPVKRAMKKKAEIDKAIAEWILDNPMPYAEVLVPGDTIIIRDTIDYGIVVSDTIVKHDTVRIRMDRWRTVRETSRVVDTFIRTVSDHEQIRRLMDDRAALQSKVQTLETQKRLNFWIIVALIAVASASIMFGLRKWL